MINRLRNHVTEINEVYGNIEQKLSSTILNTEYRTNNAHAYHEQSNQYTSVLQSKSIQLPQFIRYLENLLEIGFELGIWAFYRCAKRLRRTIQTRQISVVIVDVATQTLVDECLQCLDCVIDDILKNLCQLNIKDIDMLISNKVQLLVERISTHEGHVRCIVFVERIQMGIALSELLTALFSCLSAPLNNRLRVKHTSGTNSATHGMTVRSQV
jgi:hypothetical protein